MILTQNTLRNAAQEARNKYIYNSINESLSHFDSSAIYDLFISHSFKDKDLVIGLKYLFEITGYRVYIDWVNDSTLDRQNVTINTATLIKLRIRQSKGTSYIATSNSSQSKWCPWELGVSDGMKGRVCILPVMDSAFKGQEYLGLYPYLEYGLPNKEASEFYVVHQQYAGKSVSLRSWLSGMDPQ